MARITVIACIAAAAAISPAWSERGGAPSGPSKDVVTRWFTGAGGPVCTDAAGSDTACDPGRVLASRTYHDAGGEHALLFVAYSPAVGNAAALAVAQFRRGERGWAFVRTLSGVYGEGPDTMSFRGGKATFVMNALMPSDARCCLIGKQRYAVELATGIVTAGPKTPVAATPASASRRFAPRTEGYEGAAYVHNGSMVLVDERAGTIRYEIPKSSIRLAAGKGTILFRGTFAASGAVTGTAYAFKAGCEPAPYAVSGRSRGPSIELKGRAPNRDPNSCAVTGMTDHGAHTLLTFREYGDF